MLYLEDEDIEGSRPPEAKVVSGSMSFTSWLSFWRIFPLLVLPHSFHFCDWFLLISTKGQAPTRSMDSLVQKPRNEEHLLIYIFEVYDVYEKLKRYGPYPWGPTVVLH